MVGWFAHALARIAGAGIESVSTCIGDRMFWKWVGKALLFFILLSAGVFIVRLWDDVGSPGSDRIHSETQTAVSKDPAVASRSAGDAASTKPVGTPTPNGQEGELHIL